MNLRTLSALAPEDQPRGKTVIVRVDYNVPLEERDGILIVKDDQRVQNSRATIDWLLERGNKVVLISHLGRPTGDPAVDVPKFSLRSVYNFLTYVNWWPQIAFCEETIGVKAEKAVADLPEGGVLLLENLRFNSGEKKNDPEFVQALAGLADLYIDEGFSAAHRAHASTVGLAEALPSYAGLALESEVAALEKIINEPKGPLVVVVGGAKISDKVEAVANLARVADVVLVGGGVSNNFIKAEGIETHKSYIQDAPADLAKQGKDYVAVAKDIIDANKFERYLKDDYIPLTKIVYPFDVITAPSVESDESQAQNMLINRNMPDSEPDENIMYLDIGPRTTKLYQEIILAAGTVFWNGPMGVFENSAFANGTREVARAIAKTSALTVIGGGDTIAAAKEFEYEGRVDFISTGGSAGLEFLAGKKLPGLAVLED